MPMKGTRSRPTLPSEISLIWSSMNPTVTSMSISVREGSSRVPMWRVASHAPNTITTIVTHMNTRVAVMRTNPHSNQTIWSGEMVEPVMCVHLRRPGLDG